MINAGPGRFCRRLGLLRGIAGSWFRASSSAREMLQRAGRVDFGSARRAGGVWAAGVFCWFRNSHSSCRACAELGEDADRPRSANICKPQVTLQPQNLCDPFAGWPWTPK